MEEIWKPMFYKDMDLSDRFLVSNKGNIYSLISNKILKQTPNKSTGYYGLCVSLGGRNNRKYLKTHIAVASTFVFGCKNNLVVNHKDGNKKNNDETNLEWVTSKQNTIHAIEHGLLIPKKGCELYNSRIKEEDVRNIRKRLENKERQCDIARDYNVSSDVIYHIAHNQSYRNVV